MKLVIEIDMNNAAFDGDYRRELRRILTESVLGKLRDWSPSTLESDPMSLRDVNGNRCGEFRIVTE